MAVPAEGRAAPSDCELCSSAGGRLLWSGGNWRIVRVQDTDFPAFYRVISLRHVREFSELPAPERQHSMELVCAVERVLIEQLRPTKVNLAALGNMAPHLHWHVIARFDWDSHFPQSIWGPRQRDVNPAAELRLGIELEALDGLVTAAASGA
ncbi:HIT family protein [Piscinibacter sp.]|uniref:HIT family protein n=1 Tax=Piscinibacter sp. TaxID=1903157 RepID=UPI002BF79A6D|nr:HIT family protein [Albitalea sp.]HUG22124.1 HIT family protein [Albitalea sp.]